MDRNIGSQYHFTPVQVALRKESVDRNLEDDDEWERLPGRSPQGERG